MLGHDRRVVGAASDAPRHRAAPASAPGSTSPYGGSTSTALNGVRVSGVPLVRKLTTSARTTWPFDSRRARRRFSPMTRHALPSRSTNVALGAPRLSASMPAAPLPAKRSRNGPSSAPLASSAAKSASLTRSVRGRVPVRRCLETGAACRAGDDPAGVRHPASAAEHLAGADAAQASRRELVLQICEPGSNPPSWSTIFSATSRARSDIAGRAAATATRRAAAAAHSATVPAARPRALLEVHLGEQEAVRAFDSQSVESGLDRGFSSSSSSGSADSAR